MSKDQGNFGFSVNDPFKGLSCLKSNTNTITLSIIILALLDSESFDLGDQFCVLYRTL